MKNFYKIFNFGKIPNIVFIIIGIMLLVPNISFAQGNKWELLAEYRGNNATGNFKDIQMVSDAIGFAISNKDICKTIDSGKTWKKVYTSDQFQLRSLTQISFFNSEYGVILNGGDGSVNPSILVTNNGGVSWTEKILEFYNSRPSYFKAGVLTIDSNTICIYGTKAPMSDNKDTNKIYISYDYGSTWSSINLTSKTQKDGGIERVNDAKLISKNTLEILYQEVYDYNPNNGVRRYSIKTSKINFLSRTVTDDKLFANTNIYYEVLFDLSFLKNIDAIDYGNIYYPRQFVLRNATKNIEYEMYSGLVFTDSLQGFYFSNYSIFRTIDGGKTWEAYYQIDNKCLSNAKTSIYKNTIVVIGCLGNILSSTDKGKSWNSSIASGIEINDHTFLKKFKDKKSFILMNGNTIININEQNKYQLLYSQVDTDFKRSINPRCLSLMDTNIILIGGTMGEVLFSNDLGKNWNYKTIATYQEDFVDVQVIDQSTFLVASEKSLYFSQDIGKTWKKLNIDGVFGFIKGIKFKDVNYGYLFTDYATYKTLDGGKKWIKQGLFYFYQNHLFLENNIEYDFDNYGISKSTDGGKSWESVCSHNFIYTDYFEMLDENNGILFDVNDGLYSTQDGCKSWHLVTEKLQPVKYSRGVTKLAFHDLNFGLAAITNSGQILKYTPSNELMFSSIPTLQLIDKSLTLPKAKLKAEYKQNYRQILDKGYVRFQLSSDSNFNYIILDTNMRSYINGAVYIPGQSQYADFNPDSLGSGGKYYVRCKALNMEKTGKDVTGESDWSNYQSFETPVPEYIPGDIPYLSTIHEGGELKFTFRYDRNNTPAKYKYEYLGGGAISTPPMDEAGNFLYHFNEKEKHPIRMRLTAEAISGGTPKSQELMLIPVHKIANEDDYFSPKPGSVPDIANGEWKEYTSITKKSIANNNRFNHGYPSKLREYAVSASILIIDPDHINGIHKETHFSGSLNRDVSKVVVYADSLVVRGPWQVAGANLEIHSRILKFEKNSKGENGKIISSGAPSLLDTTISVPKSGIRVASGTNAGNIELFVKTIISDVNDSTLFELNGGRGQNLSPTSPGGWPGIGGMGGILSYPNGDDLLPLISGRVKTESGLMGQSGSQKGDIILPTSPGQHIPVYVNDYSWCDASALRFTSHQIEQAFLARNNTFALSRSKYYVAIIDEVLKNSIDEDLNNELIELRQNLSFIAEKIEAGYDFFGNPAGWAPMLSFNSNLEIFRNEIERSLSSLYIGYWLGNKSDSVNSAIQWLEKLRSLSNEELTTIIHELNNLNTLENSFKARLSEVETEQRSVENEMKSVLNDLASRAESNVRERNKPRGWKKWVQAFGTIMIHFPIKNDISTAIGYGLRGLTYLDLSKGLGFNVNVVKNTVKDIKNDVKNSTKERMIDAELAAKYESGTLTQDDASKAQESLRMKLARAKQGMSALKDIFYGSAGADEVAAEFDNLRRADARYATLVDRATDLALEREGLLLQLLSIRTRNEELTTAQFKHLKIIAEATTGLEQSNDIKLSHKAHSIIKDMEASARERLLRYNYYLAKAAEYHFAETLVNVNNFNNVLQEMIKLGASNSGGQKLLTTDQIKQIYDGVYEGQILAPLRDKIITRLQESFNPSYERKVVITIPSSIVQKINKDTLGQKFSFNIARYLRQNGKISEADNNLRLKDIVPLKITSKNAVNPQDNGEYRLNVTHSGLSRISQTSAGVKNNYLFRHYNNQGSEPIKWLMIQTLGKSKPEELKIPKNVDNLLKSLLGKNINGDIYATPGLDADIYFSKEDKTPNKSYQIDSLELEVTYQFETQIATSIRELIVSANDNLTPHFIVDKNDMNNRKDGRGYFTRYFSSSVGNVNISAPEDQGLWKFKNWSDNFGNPFPNLEESKNKSINVDLSKRSVIIQANYSLPITDPVIYGDSILNAGDSSYYFASAIDYNYGDTLQFQKITTLKQSKVADTNFTENLWNANKTINGLTFSNQKLSLSKNFEGIDTIQIKADLKFEGNNFKKYKNVTLKGIPTQTFTLEYPNGGEELITGENVEIKWNKVENIEYVKLEYSIDNGKTWILIELSIKNIGSYKWKIPGTESNQCLVRVSNSLNTSIFVNSKAPFTIKKTNSVEENSGEINYLQLSMSPNPASNEVIITFNNPTNGKVIFNLYDISGRFIETIIDKDFENGLHTINFNTNSLPNASYFIEGITNTGIRSNVKFVVNK